MKCVAKSEKKRGNDTGEVRQAVLFIFIYRQLKDSKERAESWAVDIILLTGRSGGSGVVG